ncbi:MAG: PQQ-dependent sugar dehydrogenase, partial [Gammaproteobacteria bacterium]
MKHHLLPLCLIAALVPACNASPPGGMSDEQPGFVLEKVAQGLGVPWGLAFISERDLLITERSGTVRLLNTESGALTDIEGAPQVLTDGQGGLLDVAVPPDFQTGGWIYFTFVRDRVAGGVTVL